MQATRTPPKASVCVITYNQEAYIRECLQSIVDQMTDFDFEVIVGDDCSCDGTREAVIEFAERYPGKIVPLLYPHKVGGTQNFISVHNRAAGKYVAHIDGDDIALPGKLQAQVNYLEAHPDCSVVWHRVLLFNDAGTLCKPNLHDVGVFEDGIVLLSEWAPQIARDDLRVAHALAHFEQAGGDVGERRPVLEAGAVRVCRAVGAEVAERTLGGPGVSRARRWITSILSRCSFPAMENIWRRYWVSTATTATPVSPEKGAVRKRSCGCMQSTWITISRCCLATDGRFSSTAYYTCWWN